MTIVLLAFGTLWYNILLHLLLAFSALLRLISEIYMRLYLRRDFASKRLLLLCCYFRRLNMELIASLVWIIPKPFNAPWKYKQLVVLLFLFFFMLFSFFLCCSLSRPMLPFKSLQLFCLGPVVKFRCTAWLCGPWTAGRRAAAVLGAGFCRQNLGIKCIPCVGIHLWITMAVKSTLSYCQIYSVSW